MFRLVSLKTSRTFSAKLLSSWSVPISSHPGTWTCSSPGAELCVCLDWSSWDSSLPISPAYGGPSEWQHKQLSCVSVPPPSSELSINLLKMHSASTCKSLMNGLNNVGPSINPLWYSTSDCPPSGLHATDHNPLSLAVFGPLDGGSMSSCLWLPLMHTGKLFGLIFW